jgi:transposase-like protein
MAKHTQRGESTSSSQRRYTPEFKRDAVALYKTSGKSIAAVARELGMNDVTLGAWTTPRSTRRPSPQRQPPTGPKRHGCARR